MHSNRSLLLLLALILVLLSANARQTNNTAQSTKHHAAGPDEVVRQYCEFDFKIGRISSENFAQLPPLTTWEEESGWDGATVVSGFQIVSTKMSQDRTIVTARWQVLGDFSAERVVAEQKEEVVEYQLKRVGALWKIDSPVISPHVSVATLRAFALKNFPDDLHRQELIRQLDSLREKKR
jgi:hypothetical protein